jgi:heme-degrading monooxygenase HmoA
MILEHALLNVRPGEEEAFVASLKDALALISATPGFISLKVSQGVESPSDFVLLVEWESLEDHTVGFRGSDRYEPWRAALHHFYDPMPVVEHFSLVVER